MLNEEERKEIRARLGEKLEELAELKRRQHELHLQKEKAFAEKKKISDSIIETVKTLREAKGLRNTLTKQVKDSKSRRSELNTALQQKIDEFKKLQAEKRAMIAKLGIRFDPARIRQEIEQLEFKIETEAPPFKIEQQMMMKIHQKKRLLEQTKEVNALFEKVRVHGKEIDKLRKKADEAHHKIQSKASESQEHHQELLESSKELRELDKQEEAAFKKFLDAKKAWSDATDALKAKAAESTELRKKLDEEDRVERQNSAVSAAQTITEKKQDVEEKIKKRQKLTTEDLLAFQAQANVRAQGLQRPSRRR
ncbi:hypothetical protein HZB03_00665 [Candidatus Woesearchaeota archaeon]|nr:hypothetical protein [Candidatus Woesearchaeota archaeon]